MFGNLYRLTKSQTGERTSGEFDRAVSGLRDLTSEIPRVQLQHAL